MNKFGIKHHEQNYNSFYKIGPENTLNLDLAITFYVKHIMFHVMNNFQFLTWFFHDLWDE